MKKPSNGMLTASNVANMLDISVKTLTNWYQWYHDESIKKPDEFPKLPEYVQENKNSPRYWTKEDVKQLRKFQKWMPRGRGGVMGEVSCKFYNKKKNEKELERENISNDK